MDCLYSWGIIRIFSVEMRHSVTTLSYRARRIIDQALSHVFRSPPPTQTMLKLTAATAIDPKTTSTLPTPAPGATAPFPSHLSRDYPGGWISLYTMVRETPALPFFNFLCACLLFLILFLYFPLHFSVINAIFSFFFLHFFHTSSRPAPPLAYLPAKRSFGILLVPTKRG